MCQLLPMVMAERSPFTSKFVDFLKQVAALLSMCCHCKQLLVCGSYHGVNFGTKVTVRNESTDCSTLSQHVLSLFLSSLSAALPRHQWRECPQTNGTLSSSSQRNSENPGLPRGKMMVLGRPCLTTLSTTRRHTSPMPRRC